MSQPYICKKCGKEMWSFNDVVEYWDDIYCKWCNPNAQVDNKPIGEKQIVNKLKDTDSQKTILLVDDDVYIRKLYIEEFSEVFGDRVKTIAFPDGIPAFDFFKENLNNVHLIISNILMPGIDGIKFLKLCKKLAPNIPFIICTSLDKATSEADAYIVKGADFLSELLDAVRKLLDIDDDSRVLKEVNLRENKKPIETHNKVSSNQQVEELPPIPVAYGSAFEGEMIKKEDMFIEFGGQRTPSFEWVRMKELDEIEDNKVIVVGTDWQARYENGGQMPLGIVIDVAGRTMQKDFESIIEKKVHHNINEAQGLWHMGQRDLNWIRINHNAKKEGFALEHIGYIMTTMTHHRFKSIVDKVQVTIYVDEKDVLAVLEDARKAYKERDHQAHSKTQEKEITVYKKGDFIGQEYEVYDVLGMGGFGVVYLIYHHGWKAIYAMKTLRGEYLKETTTIDRFKKEAKIWIDFDRHPYLVRAYEVEEIADQFFIVIEYIAPNEKGLNTLDAYLKYRPPDLTQSLRWAIQFCYGMEYAYAKGIKAHRDIKPANIMITHDKTLKISDFGLAGVIGESKVASGIKIDIRQGSVGFSCQTMEGVGFGTPTHMPPEQFTNAAGCDERSDIYSFGVVLYQMATGGKLPFLATLPRNDDYEESRRFWIEMHKLHSQAPVPKLSTPLFPIIFRCLEKNPINRYFSFKELRKDLEKLFKKQTGEVIMLPQKEELEIWELVTKGKSLGNLNKYQEAIDCYDKALRINDRIAGPWFGKGFALQELQNYQEALDCYNRALEIDPNHAGFWFAKGVLLLYCIGKPLESITCFDQELKISPGDAESWCWKGHAFRKLGKWQNAANCYDKALEINPRDAMAWSNKGDALESLGKYQEAIACHDRALEINPRYAEAWCNKGVALDGLGKYQEALAVNEGNLEKFLNLDGLGKYQGALACYDRALEINPRYAQAWFNKGVALRGLGKYQEAIVCYDRALEINPRDAKAWYNKGDALDSLGKYQEAIACYDRVLEINPGYAAAWYNKAFAEDKLGRGQDAVFSYKRFIELAPIQYAKQVEYARKRLRELGER